jgi:hypothetical protein
MSDQTKDCEECYGTGNEPRMRAVQPGRKILFQPCPDAAERATLQSGPQSQNELWARALGSRPMPLHDSRKAAGESDFRALSLPADRHQRIRESRAAKS